VRNNVILHYTVITLLVTLLVSAGLGAVLSRRAGEHLINTHSSVYPDVIQVMVKDHPEFFAFLRSPAGASIPDNARTFLDDLLSIKSVFRIKVWSSDGTILWSDRSELIGRNFRDNPHFQSALGGIVSWEMGKPRKAEHAFEQKEAMVLEIYTPVKLGDRCVGVLELYESDSSLQRLIASNTRTIWLLVGTASTVLYLLLFLVFYRAHSRQEKTNEHLIETQNVTIYALAYQAELHDVETGSHLDRTAHYVRLLAEGLKKEPEYRKYLTERYIEDLVRSAPLHDIGKVGVPDAILRKPGKLTEEEFEQMKRHAEYGTAILRRAEEKLSFQSFLQLAIQISSHHHEKWDGSGYPQGLKGESIPLSARIMSLADAYDALRSRRYYKEPIPHGNCIDIIRNDAGTHFDPLVVAAFVSQEDRFRQISERLAD
jgi:HD-GYP domain-containing protein (c-di-GMP phosphodiesterase class II)